MPSSSPAMTASKSQIQPLSTVKAEHKYQEASNREDWKMISLRVPAVYPPIETNADARVPLHFMPLPGLIDLKPASGGMGGTFQGCYESIDHDITELLASVGVSAQRFGLFMCTGRLWPGLAEKGLIEQRLLPASVTDDELMDVHQSEWQHMPLFYMVHFAEGQAKRWPVVDRTIREILRMSHRSIGRKPPSLRYF